MSRSTKPGLPRLVGDEFRSERLFSSLTAGVLIGISEVIFALSVGSLIFSGELAPYISYGIGIALVTTTILLVVTSLGSSTPGVTGSLQDSTSVILAVIAAALVGASSAAGVEDRFATVLATITATALLTGAFLLALGLFKLGGLVRFIPYPVVGGFLAGTGWLLVQGSFGVMADYPLTASNVSALLQSKQLLLWVPGLLLALLLFFGSRRSNHILVMPGILIGFTLILYLGLPVIGLSMNEAYELGLLLGESSKEATWQPLMLANLFSADWASILRQGGNIITILIISVTSLLLNASALELIFHKDIDLNRELRVAGLANLLSGIGGGMFGHHAVDISTLSYRLGALSRLPGVVAGAICLGILFFGSPLLAFFPRPVLGGLLLFMGLGFLFEWVVTGWSKLPRSDYAVVLLILIVIGTTDFLVGVGVGLVAMIILFVVNYSRINVVRLTLSGAEMNSNVMRSAYQQRALRELGKHIYILELQGFIFFGTANAILEHIRSQVGDSDYPDEHTQAQYILLDFCRVTGLDSSAVTCFAKGRQLARRRGITLVLTSVSDEIRRQFKMGGLFESDSGDDTGMRIFPDLDYGLEWCEDRILESEQIIKTAAPVTLSAQLEQSGFENAFIQRLMGFLERVEIEGGDYLLRQGEASNDLYIIESGRVSVHLELEEGKQARLRTMSVGTVVGEIGLYQGTERTASVIADRPTIAYRLTREALLDMREKDPELASAFHEFMVRLLTNRVADTNHLLEAVMK